MPTQLFFFAVDVIGFFSVLLFGFAFWSPARSGGTRGSSR
jgi:hypothetical protein